MTHSPRGSAPCENSAAAPARIAAIAAPGAQSAASASRLKSVVSSRTGTCRPRPRGAAPATAPVAVRSAPAARGPGFVRIWTCRPACSEYPSCRAHRAGNTSSRWGSLTVRAGRPANSSCGSGSSSLSSSSIRPCACSIFVTRFASSESSSPTSTSLGASCSTNRGRSSAPVPPATTPVGAHQHVKVKA